MIEKQNAVELKEAAGDAAEIDDVIDAGTHLLAEPKGHAKHTNSTGCGKVEASH